MGSFEWMELQTLTGDINASRSRLAAARANKDSRLIRVLEQEITEAEARRDRLLASITTNLAGVADAAQNLPAQTAADDGEPEPVPEPVAEDVGEPELEPVATAAAESEVAAAVDGAEPPAEPDMPQPAPADPAPAETVRGGMIVWDQLTPNDIERAQAELGARRAEMLARHAEELKALEVEQSELENLERAIDAFVRRLAKTEPGVEGAGADVVDLGASAA